MKKELKKELEEELNKLKESLEKAIELDMLPTTIYKLDGKIEVLNYVINKIEEKGGK